MSVTVSDVYVFFFYLDLEISCFQLQPCLLCWEVLCARERILEEGTGGFRASLFDLQRIPLLDRQPLEVCMCVRDSRRARLVWFSSECLGFLNTVEIV